MKNTNHYLLLLVILIIISSGCFDGIAISEHQKVVAELEQCKATVIELENTSAKRFSRGLASLQNGEIEGALSEFKDLVQKFPASLEAERANEEIAKIEVEIAKEKEAEERRKRLGFKVLKEAKTINLDNLTLKFTEVKSSKRYVFDRYGDRYMYRDVERGNKYITSKVSITSKVNNPLLPPIHLYKIQDGKLVYLSSLEYRFYRWKDYATYLGNYADYGNDFAQTERIRFSLGGYISDADIKDEVVFVLVEKLNCVARKSEELANPPISYSYQLCEDIKNNLSVDDVDSDFIVVEVFNSDKM